MTLTEAQRAIEHQEHWSCGWNRGVLDYAEGVANTLEASEGRTGKAYESFIEGYYGGQEYCLLERAKLRDETTP